jgi:hypothetical protein
MHWIQHLSEDDQLMVKFVYDVSKFSRIAIVAAMAMALAEMLLRL